MITVKFERYWNDFHRKDETLSFASLTAFEDWLFDQMQQDYVNNKFCMSFPTLDAAKRINAIPPWDIRVQPKRGEETFFIHLIRNEQGIIFSDGKLTANKRHWTIEVALWCAHCEQRRSNPTFDFV